MILSTTDEISALLDEFPEDEVAFALEVWHIEPGLLSPRDALRRHASGLRGEDEELFRDYLNMRLDPDELTPEEEERCREGREQIARGEFVTLEELEAELGL